MLPPIYNAPEIPTPPCTTSAPVVVLVLAVPDPATTFPPDLSTPDKFVTPLALPMFNVVAAPNALTVVATVLYKFCTVCVPTNVGLPIVAVPLVAPIPNVVAAPNAFTVVATVL